MCSTMYRLVASNENGGVFDMFDSVCKLSIAHSDCQSCQFGEFYLQWLLGGMLNAILCPAGSDRRNHHHHCTG